MEQNWPLWPVIWAWGHCYQYGNHGPVSWEFTLRKATRLFSASALFWASSSNLEDKERDKVFQCTDFLQAPRIFFFKRGCEENMMSLSKNTNFCLWLHRGVSWQKAFWINLLIHSPVKRFWECAQWDRQLLLSTNVFLYQFNKVTGTHLTRLRTHTDTHFPFL